MASRLNRRSFLGVGAAAYWGVQTLPCLGANQTGSRVSVCNPLLRTPLSLIVDDSCPVINKAYYWIKQRHDWRMQHHPDAPPTGWEKHYDELNRMPNTIPAAFAAEWGEWCGEQGIKGKFSMIPYPAGIGRIDQGFPGFPASELDGWLHAARDILWKNFDLTPEILSHTRVVDLKTWKLTEAWEQFDWMDPPVELLTDYIATAMQLLKNVGIACEGVTSPGHFGEKKESAYARAVLDASVRVNGNARPFYYLWSKTKQGDFPEVPLWHVDKPKGAAVASIVGCTDDWFGQTGFDPSDPDLFITADLQHGRLPAVLANQTPCVLISHWPCFYANDHVGFKTLKTIKQRLDAYDPDKTKTLWLKNSEIGHYWMARQLSQIEVAEAGSECTVRIATQFPSNLFTLAVHDWAARRVQVGGKDLAVARSRQDFREGTFFMEGQETFLAFSLNAGDTTLAITR